MYVYIYIYIYTYTYNSQGLGGTLCLIGNALRCSKGWAPMIFKVTAHVNQYHVAACHNVAAYCMLEL